MKITRTIVFLTLLSIVLSSCGRSPSGFTNSVTYYYRTVEVKYGVPDGVVAAEVRDIDASSNDYEKLISTYLNGPREHNHISPYPAGIYLVQLTMGADRVYITLSSHLSMLTGSDLMIACACLTRTVLGITGVRSIEISAEKGLLNGQQYLIFTMSDFTYLDSYSGSSASD